MATAISQFQSESSPFQREADKIRLKAEAIRRSHHLRLGVAAALGAATALVLAFGALPPGIVVVAVALASVLLLPERVRLVAAFAAGASATLAILAGTWLVSWGCAGGLLDRGVDQCGRTAFLEFQVTSP